MPNAESKPSTAELAGLFFLSAAILLFEVGLIRLFSLILWHQVAALVVAVAFLGLGVSGSLLTVLPDWARSRRVIGYCALLFALSCVAAYLIARAIPFDPSQMAWAPWHGLRLGLHALVLAVPFVFGGAAVALFLGRYSRYAGRVYFADMGGAAVGAMAVLPAFAFGGPGPVLTAALLGGLAAWLLAVPPGRSLRFSAALVTVAAGLGLLFTPVVLQPRVSPYAELTLTLRHPQARHGFSAWNALGRVDVVDSPAIRDAPGLSLREAVPVPLQAGVTVNGSGLGGILLDPGDAAFLDRLPSAAVYAAAPVRRVLVIEPGGGIEVWNALVHGAQTVIAVVSNPLLRAAVDARAGSSSPYRQPGVRVLVESGRTALAGFGKFDAIVLAGVRGGPVSSGIEPVRHEFDLTAEAFVAYLDHLAPGGVLTVSRYLIPPPRAELRLVSLAIEALQRRGAAEPGAHLAVLRSWGTLTLLVSATPLVSRQSKALRRFSDRRGFDLVSLPGLSREAWNRHNRFSEPLYEKAVAALLSDPKAFVGGYRYDVAPPTDARPYFSHLLRWDKVGVVWKELQGDVAYILEAGYLLPVVLFQVLVLALVVIVLPLLFRGRPGSGVGTYLVYFGLLGLAYMAVEMALLVPVALLLGQPVYGVAVILAALLIGSGLGSLASERLAFRVEGGPRQLLARVLPVVAVGIVVLSWVSGAVVGNALGWGLAPRVFLALGLVIPIGFVMGMPFPLGIRLLGAVDRGAVPWAWAANGCASVVGALAAPLLALAWGYPGLLLGAAAAYGLAWRFLPRR